MAAEKARTNPQRVANYWSVKDDASHSPSSSSKLGAAKGSDHLVQGFMPDDQTYSNTEPQSEIRWWLNLEPTVSHLEDNEKEDSNAFEAEFGVYGAASLNRNVTITGEKECGVYGAASLKRNVTITGEKRSDEEGDIEKYLKGNDGNLVDSPQKAFVNFMKNDQDDKMEELKVVIKDDTCRAPHKEMGESWYVDDNWKDLDPCKCSVHEKSEKLCSELESQWIEVEKNEPWWRTADKDDLTSLVSSKKLEQFENCDLPQPQSKNWSGPFECFDEATILASLGQNVDKETDLDEQTSEIPKSVSMFETQRILGAVQCLPSSSDRLIRSDGGTTVEEEAEALQMLDNDLTNISRSDGFTTVEEEAEALLRLNSELTKAQLLEALCHSQTRAREAEKAAQQAYDEKEHIVTHFFRQASHLFAYRQWLQMLQIETLCIQLKNSNNESISAHFPGLLAASSEGKKAGKGRRKAAKRVGIPNYKLIRRSVAGFAIGLSLAGAGLLLGWTLGRFFPAL